MTKRILMTAGVRWWNASAHYTVDQARALTRRGHQLVLAVREGTPAAVQAERAGLDVRKGFDFRAAHLGSDVARMVRLLREQPFDILNPHRGGDQTVVLIARKVARVGSPVLRTRVDVKEFRPHPANVLVYGHLLAGILAPGDLSRRMLVDHYRVPPARIETVHGGVDTDRFDPERRDLALRRALGVPDDRLAVGLVARLGRIKGHTHFFDAIARLASRNGNTPAPVWLVIGPETDFTVPELTHMAAQAGAKDVIFTGYRADIAEVMACLDVGVVTSIGSEAHCRVGLELLASGVPVVGTRVGVIPEIIDEGETGFVVPPCDGAALAQALLRLVADTDLRQGFSRAARRRALDIYTFQAWAARTEDAFERLTRNGRPHPAS